MGLRKFGLFAAMAALIVGGFTSCGKDTEVNAPTIVVKDHTDTEVNELTQASFGQKGLFVYVTPGKSDDKPVKMKGDLKVSYTLKGQTDVKKDVEFKYGKIGAGDRYTINIKLSDLGITDSEISSATGGSFSFEAKDENDKIGSKTLQFKAGDQPNPPTPNPPAASTPMEVVKHNKTQQDRADETVFYVDHRGGSGYAGINLATGAPVVKTENNPNVICEGSVNSEAFTHTLVKGPGSTAKFRKVTNDLGDMTYDNVTMEKLTALAKGSLVEKLTVEANDLVLVVIGNDLYLLKIIEVNSLSVFMHDNGTFFGDGKRKGYIKFSYKKGSKK